MKRIGFTLIELLVVIATIAILTAILFPVIAMDLNDAAPSHFPAGENGIRYWPCAISPYGQHINPNFQNGGAALPGEGGTNGWSW